MSTVHASFQVDLETKKYADGLARIQNMTKGTSARMVADMAATEKATERLGNAAERASKGYSKMGQVSMQVQDVAVQLQSGTKMATIFAQQGSQIASIFGSGGAIIGGVLAIGAGIYSWVTAAKSANKEFEEGEKRLKAMQSAGEQLRTGAKTDAGATRVAQTLPGADQELMRLRVDHEKEMEQIRERARVSGDAAMQRLAEGAENERFEAEKTAIVRKQTLEMVEKRTAQEHEIDKQRTRAREADQERVKVALTDAQKMKVVEKEIDAIKNRTKRSGTHDDRLKEATSIANLAEKELEKERIKKDIQTEQTKLGRKLLEDSIEWADKVEETRKKLTEAHREMGQARAIRTLERSAASGQSILDQASEFRKSPSERAADRQEAKDQARAERRNEGDILDKADRFNRRHGGSGLTQEERQKRVAEMRADVNNARNKNKIQADISDDSIEKLGKKIESLEEALIEK